MGSEYGRLFHAAIQLVNRNAKEFGGPGVGDDAFHKSSQTQTLEPAGSDPLYRVGFLVRRAAPSETLELVEEEPEQGGAEDAKILTAIRKGLHADTEDTFQLE